MNEDQFLLYDHQKPILLKAEKISFYLQGEIIEAFTENNEVYYLIFYKYQFLTAVKAIRLRRKSYIEDSFKKGMVFNAPHPFINGLLSSNAPLKIISFQPLIKNLIGCTLRKKNPLFLPSLNRFFQKSNCLSRLILCFLNIVGMDRCF